MTASPTAAGSDRPAGAAFSDRQPVTWINAVAHQVAHEASLVRTPDIEDLVIIAYVGLLDSPDPGAVDQDHLLTRCRQQLVTWAWEQGNADEPVPFTRARSPSQSVAVA